ncbi:hypothetical protein ACJX0J_039533, partial [Zea mays]
AAIEKPMDCYEDFGNFFTVTYKINFQLKAVASYTLAKTRYIKMIKSFDNSSSSDSNNNNDNNNRAQLSHLHQKFLAATLFIALVVICLYVHSNMIGRWEYLRLYAGHVRV